MKKLNKLFIILLCCVGAMSVTSCLDGDEGGGLDPETVRAYLNQMRGSYIGGSGTYANKIYFYNDTITDKNNPYKTDSLSGYGVNGGVNYTITAAGRDSASFVVNGIEGRVLAKDITDEKYKGLKEAIENAPSQSVRGPLSIVGISGELVYVYFYPMPIEYKDLEYDGGTHDVTITFWSPSQGNYFMHGVYKVLQIPLVRGTVNIDGEEAFTIYNAYSHNDEAYAKALLRVQLCQ